MTPLTPALQATPRYELPSECREIPKQPVELNVYERRLVEYSFRNVIDCGERKSTKRGT
jgi:hypothetical protein